MSASATGLAETVAALLDAHPDGRLPIRQAGDPVLRRPAAPFDGQLDAGLLERFLQALRTTMVHAPGVGLAAPQVGVGLAVVVVHDAAPGPAAVNEARERVPVGHRALLDPRYVALGQEQVSFYEGCLSVAGWQAVRPRWRTVELRALDPTGAPVREVLTGWPARIVQHECDHLTGELYLDRAVPRSLCAAEHLDRWVQEPHPQRAARELGFELPPRARVGDPAGGNGQGRTREIPDDGTVVDCVALPSGDGDRAAAEQSEARWN